MNPFRPILLALACLFSLGAKEVKVVVLATTDLHGNIYPYDYLTGQTVPRGLAKIATVIKQERTANPSALLVDCGDTIQGATLEGIYQQYVRTGKFPLGLKPSKRLTADPMMLAMNYLRFDAMAVGNHEYNYGLDNLDKARSAARFPWLSANTKVAAEAGHKPFEAYTVKTVDGIKVAIIGITTPAVPAWEKPENFKHYTFIDAKEATEAAVSELRAKHQPDLILVAAHAGLDRDLKTGAIRQGDSPRENMIYAIATGVAGVDAIVYGHTHQELEDARVNGVLLTQPKNWGTSLARMEFVFDSESKKLIRKSSKLLPANDAAPDAEVLNIAKPYHDLAEAYLNTKVTQSRVAMNASESRIEDTAMIDAIHEVQLHFAKADVSFASSFNPRAAVPEGPVTVRQIAALYLYDNELYAIEGNGKMVREALENAARFYNSCPDAVCTSGPLLNRGVIPYNYDMAQGVTYDIDLTKPVGSRVQNLKFKGAPLNDDQPLRIAVNNYRAGGSGGYRMFRGAKVVYRSYDDIRELMIRYYTTHPLPSSADNNWQVIPENAHRQLESESRALAGRPMSQ